MYKRQDDDWSFLFPVRAGEAHSGVDYNSGPSNPRQPAPRFHHARATRPTRCSQRAGARAPWLSHDPSPNALTACASPLRPRPLQDTGKDAKAHAAAAYERLQANLRQISADADADEASFLADPAGRAPGEWPIVAHNPRYMETSVSV